MKGRLTNVTSKLKTIRNTISKINNNNIYYTKDNI